MRDGSNIETKTEAGGMIARKGIGHVDITVMSEE